MKNAAVHRVWWRVALLTLLAAVLVIGSGAGFAYARLQGNIKQTDVTDLLGNDRARSYPDQWSGKALNFLVLGSDVRAGDSDIDHSGARGAVTGMRADTTMIMHISADRKRVDMVSIPRDTLVDQPSCKIRTSDGGTTTTEARSNVMANAAFSTGGSTGDVPSAAACSMRMVENLTGLTLDGYVVVDFASFIRTVDLMGGVPMYFPEPLQDAESGLNVPQGCVLLDGNQALALARARKHIGDGSDLGRIDRQHELLTAAASEVLTSGALRNPTSLYRMMDVVTQSLNTSTGLGNISTLAGLASSLSGLSLDRIHMATMPWNYEGNRVSVDPSAKIVWEALSADKPFTIVEDNGRPRAVAPDATPTPSGDGSPSATTSDSPAAAAPGGNTGDDTAANSPAAPSGDASPSDSASPQADLANQCTKDNAKEISK